MNLIPAWISNHMPGKMWNEMNYPLGVDESVHLTFNNGCNYLSTMGSKLIHISKRVPSVCASYMSHVHVGIIFVIFCGLFLMSVSRLVSNVPLNTISPSRYAVNFIFSNLSCHRITRDLVYSDSWLSSVGPVSAGPRYIRDPNLHVVIIVHENTHLHITVTS